MIDECCVRYPTPNKPRELRKTSTRVYTVSPLVSPRVPALVHEYTSTLKKGTRLCSSRKPKVPVRNEHLYTQPMYTPKHTTLLRTVPRGSQGCPSGTAAAGWRPLLRTVPGMRQVPGGPPTSPPTAPRRGASTGRCPIARGHPGRPVVRGWVRVGKCAWRGAFFFGGCAGVCVVCAWWGG